MARIIKIVKDKDGKDTRVYSDNCIICNKEMIFPKDRADYMEELVPFLKEKIEQGTPCVECTKDQIEKGTFNLFSEEEINKLKVIALQQAKKEKEQEK